MKERQRLDQLVVSAGLAASREKAKALIMAGEVLVDDRPVDKPGAAIDPAAQLRLRHEPSPFASRGGEKLAGVLSSLPLAIAGRRFLDIGQSTGGFTDVLLQHGAVRVVGVDVGYGQLAEKLRQDKRVACLERTNARHLAADAFTGERFDGAVIDVSFISLKHILPAVLPHVHPGGDILALVKPQFEAGRAAVGKGGVVRDPEAIALCVAEVLGFAEGLGLVFRGRESSPLPGPKGNREVFVWWETPS